MRMRRSSQRGLSCCLGKEAREREGSHGIESGTGSSCLMSSPCVDPIFKPLEREQGRKGLRRGGAGGRGGGREGGWKPVGLAERPQDDLEKRQMTEDNILIDPRH